MYDQSNPDAPVDAFHAVGHAPRTPERRRNRPQIPDPHEGLNPAMLMTLEALEIFHWRLAFVRRPLFRDPIPVLFDRDDRRYVVIQPDGTLDESGTLKLRA